MTGLTKRPDYLTADALDSDAVRDFLHSAIDVLREATGTEAVVALEARDASGETIAVMIRAAGDFTGVTWCFPVALVRDAAMRMLPEMELDAALIHAAAAELANILTGRGAASLETHGLHIEIDPPELGFFSAPGTWATLATSRGSVVVVFHTAGVA